MPLSWVIEVVRQIHPCKVYGCIAEIVYLNPVVIFALRVADAAGAVVGSHKLINDKWNTANIPVVRQKRKIGEINPVYTIKVRTDQIIVLTAFQPLLCEGFNVLPIDITIAIEVALGA